MDFGFGMTGGNPYQMFQPTGIDAVNALLGQMPSMAQQAFGMKMRSRQQAEQGEAQRQKLEREGAEKEERRYRDTTAERKKKEEQAAFAAREEERKRILSSVAGAKQLHSTYGGPTPFNPDQAVNDYYTYGGGR